MKYDIAIIGGGPAGYNAAERAVANGLKTILFEMKVLGGVCLNEGCIPTKTLLYSAKILHNINNASHYGIKGELKPQADIKKIIERKNKTVQTLTSGVAMKLKSMGVIVVKGKAIVSGEKGNNLVVSCDGEEYNVKYLLLCMGSETIIPNIKGLSEVNYWTSKEALEITQLPKDLTIIGGGVIGIEFASFFNSMGVNVVVVEMLPEILGTMDRELSAMLRKEYTKRGVDFRLNTRVVEVTSGEVIVEYKGKTEKIPTSQTLVSIGRKAVTQQSGLESINLRLNKGGIEVNEQMQTSHPQVYACGDITGYSQLAHTAIREGEVAINHILGQKDKMNYNSVPSVVYTNPELAGVGKTEEELLADNIYFQVLKLPMAYSGRFVAENDSENGILKLLVDQDRRIIGCHALGNPASELIVIASIAIEKGFTVEEFQKQIFPHPTVGEMFHEVLFS